MVETTQPQEPTKELSQGRRLLRSFLNKNMKIKLTDGRVLIGIFLCTDKDANVILGTCDEYLNEECLINSQQLDEGPRMLGLAMVPGRHIVSIDVDDSGSSTSAPRTSPMFT